MHPIRNNVIEKQLKKIPVEKLAFSNLPAYIALQNSQYVFAKHHKLIVNALQKIEAGEINRLIVTMPPRHGKPQCIENIINIGDGSRKRLGDIKVGDEVITHKHRPRKVLEIFEQGKLPCLKIITELGRENITAYDHPYLTPKGWVLAKDLKPRDILAIVRQWEYSALPVATKPEFAFVGYMIGDGCCSSNNNSFANSDESVLHHFEKCCSDVGIDSMRKTKKSNHWEYNLHKANSILKRYGLYGKTSRTKCIPDFIFNGSRDHIKWFLAAYFDCDGHVNQRGKGRKDCCCEFYSVNKKLLMGVQHLLLRFGIRSRLSPKNGLDQLKRPHKSWRLSITSGHDVAKFYHNIRLNSSKLRRLSEWNPELSWDPEYITDRIVSIEPCGQHECRCLTVEEDKTFTVEDIVVHNTMLISEYFPAWYLGRNPSHQILAATYSFDRANDTGRRVRNQLLTALYPKIFNTTLKPADAKSAHKISTAKGGNYFSVGIGGAVVGRGAHLFLIDDPIKSREDAESDISRRKLWDWFRGVAYERLMPTNAIVIVQTRWHFDDLVGRLLEKTASQNWVCLNLPAVCDEENDLIGRKIGEALWPDYKVGYPLEVLEEKKEIIGTREWTSQYQQKPLPTGGGMVDINWFKRYNYVDWLTAVTAVKFGDTNPRVPFDIYKIICSWDTAFKEKQLNDPSACTVWGISRDNKFYLLEAFAKRIKYPTLKKKAISMWEYYMQFNCGQVVVLIEDRASGQSLIQDLRDSTRIPVVAAEAVQSKQIRMDGVTALMEAGRMYVPDRAKWLVGYEVEMARFPLWRTDDLADSTSQFLKWAGKPRYVKSKKPRFWK